MKAIHSFLPILVLCAVCAASCKKHGFLDQTATENLTGQKVFADSAMTLEFLNNIYTFTGQDVEVNRADYINSAQGNDYATLEDLTTHSLSYYSTPQSTWIDGATDATNSPFTNYYTKYYTEIVAANTYMKMVQTSPLSAAMKTRTIAEARFLRAWYYAEMVRTFGGVMLIGDTLYNISDEIQYTRNSAKDVIDYVVGQCDTAAMDLPSALTQSASDYGRVTSGACLALKARMLLMAASPLFNGSPVTTDPGMEPLVCYSATLDPTLWTKAAQAFQDVINTGAYSLYVDNSIPGNGFRNLFLQLQNNEYIMFYLGSGDNSNTTDMEYNHFPLTRGGYGESNPSQNLVDQFGMNNGLSISDPNSGYDATNPYANRDPRFYHTICYNQGLLYLTSSQAMTPVDIYNPAAGGVTEDGVQSYHTKSGYYDLKMANDSVAPGAPQNRAYPLIRYAEILLGLAEALNESQGPTAQVYQLIEQIRNRAGIEPGPNGNYGLTSGMSAAQMRSVIQNEYQVELAYEGHWYYDSRRWRLAETVENQPIQGMLATQVGPLSSTTFTYTRFTALAALFNTRMYFQPIPLTELGKSATMVQNPGW